MPFNESCSIGIELMDGTVEMVEFGSIQNDPLKPLLRRDLNADLAWIYQVLCSLIHLKSLKII